VSRFLTAHQHK